MFLFVTYAHVSTPSVNSKFYNKIKEFPHNCTVLYVAYFTVNLLLHFLCSADRATGIILVNNQLDALFFSLYRVIHKSLRDFRTRLRNNQDRQGRKEHINR